MDANMRYSCRLLLAGFVAGFAAMGLFAAIDDKIHITAVAAIVPMSLIFLIGIGYAAANIIAGPAPEQQKAPPPKP